jgi:hypothetical protein
MDTNRSWIWTNFSIRSNHLFQPTKPDCTSEGRLTVKETSPRNQLDAIKSHLLDPGQGSTLKTRLHVVHNNIPVFCLVNGSTIYYSVT